jgi:uncharacterized protein (DUF2236 family)
MTTTLPPVSGDVVGRQDIERSFARIRELVADPNHGLFGPDSMMWRMVKPLPVLPLTLVEAGLLEAPHPIIAFGTIGSNSATDFLPRYHRSADAFYDWFCGDLDSCLRAAKRVFGYHTKIVGELPKTIGGYEKGHPYEANHQDVLVWVWATIMRPLKEFYEHFCGKLTAEETARYYDDCKRFALLFGIDDTRLPADWAAFEAYFDAFAASPAMDMSEEFLNRPGPLSGEQPDSLRARLMMTWVFAVYAYRLPPHVRAQYPFLPVERRHRAVAAGTLRLLRVLWPLVPRGLQESPRCRRCWQRVGAEGEPGRLGRWLRDKLPPPYSISYRAVGLTGHEVKAPA